MSNPVARFTKERRFLVCSVILDNIPSENKPLLHRASKHKYTANMANSESITTVIYDYKKTTTRLPPGVHCPSGSYTWASGTIQTVLRGPQTSHSTCYDRLAFCETYICTTAWCASVYTITYTHCWIEVAFTAKVDAKNSHSG